jgi:hypothetical protein
MMMRTLVAAGFTALALCAGPGTALADTTEVPLDHIGPHWLGSQWHDNLGWTVKAAGDLNGDGFGDFAVSAPQDDGPLTFGSTVRIYFGRADPPWGRIHADWHDVRISDGKIGGDAVFQFSFIRDATGDGLPDLLVVEPKAAEAGKVLLHEGGGADWPTEIDAIGAVARWDGYLQSEIALIPAETRPSRALGGDLNGDGLADIVIISELFHRAWIQYSTSPYSGTTSLDSLTTVLAQCTGEVPGSEFGEDGRIADFNADGIDDLVISAPGCESGTGRVFVWYGSPLGLPSDPDLVIAGGEFLGGSLETGDLNGDGSDDLFVQERLAPAADDPNRADRGNLWVFLGDESAGLASTPDFKLIGGFSDRRFGASVAILDDISSPPDGLADIVVGAPEAAYAGIGQGAVYIFEGLSEWPAEISSDDALYRVVGSHREAWFGASLATVDDFDGDGRQEVIIGEPNYTEGDTENDFQRGRIYLFNALPDRDEDADGVSTLAGDCNDNDAAIRPTALEHCDGIDNNCNHQIDEGCDEGDDDDSAPVDDDDSAAGNGPGCVCSAAATRSGTDLLLALWGLGLLASRRYSGRRTE